FGRSNPVTLAVMCFASLLVACAGGGSGSINPPPTNEWFFVDNFSGNVSGFSTASGRLEPIPGSSVNFPVSSTFPSLLTSFAVEPAGTFLGGVWVNPQGGSTLQIANIAPGGAISL